MDLAVDAGRDQLDLEPEAGGRPGQFVDTSTGASRRFGEQAKMTNGELQVLREELEDAFEIIKTLTGFANGKYSTVPASLPPPDQVEILAVEDSPTQAALLIETLKERGYRVRHAENGEQALALVRQHKPTLVISDVLMPVMDGFALCQALRQDPATAEMSVILLTALTDPREIISGLKAGADYYLTKPYNKDILLAKIELVLGMSRERTGTQDETIEMDIAGEHQAITTNRQRLINLLFATYENSVTQNQELAKIRDELTQSNIRLKARTSALSAEIGEHKRTEILLQQAKQAAEAANRAKSQFLANMSHEIRTPMAGVLGITDLLLESELTSQQRKHLELVRLSGNALMVVINEVLDFSKIEAGGCVLEPSDFSLRRTIDDAMSLSLHVAQQKDLRLHWVTAPETPDALVGDPGYLRRVLLNLVGNAIKFTAHGEVSLEVMLDDGTPPAATNRSIRTQDEGGKHGSSAICRLRFSVRDTGMGIPKSKHELIFNAFEQGDNSATRQFGGTGLGLAISSELVALMGGRIWVESEVDRGSTFHFTAQFGVAKAVSPAPPAPASNSDSISVNALGDRPQAPLRILLAEDNPVNQELMRCLLRGRGHDVTIAEDGREAVAAARRSLFDLVLMDVQMPEMDGCDAARAIRGGEVDSHLHLPIIAMTAGAMPGERERCLASGMDDYVSKPISPKALFAAITCCLEKLSLAAPRSSLTTQEEPS